MKRNILLSVIAIAVFFVLLLPKDLPKLPGPEINGWRVNGCYEIKSDDPFKERRHIMRVLDQKQGYIKYQFWHTTIGGWDGWIPIDNSNKADTFRHIYTEIECPETIWERMGRSLKRMKWEANDIFAGRSS